MKIKGWRVLLFFPYATLTMVPAAVYWGIEAGLVEQLNMKFIWGAFWISIVFAGLLVARWMAE